MYLNKSLRLKDWNYSQNGYYFITIVTKNRKHLFGEIEDGKIELSEIGKIINKLWLNIPKHFHSILLDEYIIMPNHIHGIIVIDNVDNRHACYLQRQYQLIPIVIGSFKSAVSKQINNFFHINEIWENKYYDHIIRNDIDLNNTRLYIINNPLKWRTDDLCRK